MLLKDGAHRHASKLSGSCERVFNHVGREPAKERLKSGVVRFPRRNFMRIRIVGTVNTIVNDAIDRDVMNQERGLMSVEEDFSFSDNDSLTVVSVLVEEIRARVIFKTRESIIPLVVVVEVMVQYRWVPITATGPDDTR